MTKFTPELLAEIFKYHPPTTEERKQKHEACNKATMDFAAACVPDGTEYREWLSTSKETCLSSLAALVKPSIFLNRAEKELEYARQYAWAENTFEAIMCVQVARMLINQAITYESLGIEL
jgi:hypothetical protein